jgi:hypothetical protein
MVGINQEIVDMRWQMGVKAHLGFGKVRIGSERRGIGRMVNAEPAEILTADFADNADFEQKETKTTKP